MKHLWEALTVAALALSAFLFIELRRGEREHDRMVGEQKAWGGQRSVPDSKAPMPGGKPPAAPESARTAEEDARMAAWQKSWAEFSHRQSLRDVWGWYHEAIAKLNLPHDRQLQLLELLRQREEAGYDATEAANAVGMTDARGMGHAVADARNAVAGEIASLVGSSGLEALDASLALKGAEQAI